MADTIELANGREFIVFHWKDAAVKTLEEMAAEIVAAWNTFAPAHAAWVAAKKTSGLASMSKRERNLWYNKNPEPKLGPTSVIVHDGHFYNSWEAVVGLVHQPNAPLSVTLEWMVEAMRTAETDRGYCFCTTEEEVQKFKDAVHMGAMRSFLAERASARQREQDKLSSEDPLCGRGKIGGHFV